MARMHSATPHSNATEPRAVSTCEQMEYRTVCRSSASLKLLCVDEVEIACCCAADLRRVGADDPARDRSRVTHPKSRGPRARYLHVTLSAPARGSYSHARDACLTQPSTISSESCLQSRSLTSCSLLIPFRYPRILFPGGHSLFHSFPTLLRVRRHQDGCQGCGSVPRRYDVGDGSV